jgi:hypothetical protein
MIQARISFTFVTACWLLALTQTQAAGSGGNGDPLASCREILTEWDRIEEAEYNQTGSYRAVLSGTRDGRPRSGDYVVSTKPRHKLLTVHGEEGIEGVYARSPRYGFVLKRTAPNKDWLLTTFVEGEKERELRDLELSLVTGIGRPVLFPLGTADVGNRGSRFFEEKSMKQGLVQATYDKDRHYLKYSYDTGYAGTIETDARLSNVIVRFDATFVPAPSRRRVSFVREFASDVKRPDSALPLCKSVAYSAIDDTAGGRILADVRIAFSDYSFDPPNDDLFMLSHYGLPEPVGQPAPRRVPTYVWLLIAGAACGVIGIVFRFVSRQSPESQASASTVSPEG